jgi:hypothetical protein
MNKPPTWYWVVAVLATLWALMGCASYLHEVTMSPADLAALPANQQEVWKAMPSWLFADFAIGVWVGLAGAVMLLLRRRIARTFYIVSLVAVIVQFGWMFTMTPILQLMGFMEAAAFPIFIFVMGIVLVWFSGYAIRRGWLK